MGKHDETNMMIKRTVLFLIQVALLKIAPEVRIFSFNMFYVRVLTEFEWTTSLLC